MANGSRAGFAWANTSSSLRLCVSPKKASCSRTMERVAFNSIGFGQSGARVKVSSVSEMLE